MYNAVTVGYARLLGKFLYECLIAVLYMEVSDIDGMVGWMEC